MSGDTSRREERLTGIDGRSPLGYLAALGGWLAFASANAEAACDTLLKWSRDGMAWRPVLLVRDNVDVIEQIWRGLDGTQGAYALGEPLTNDFRKKGKAEFDIRAASQVLTTALRNAADRAFMERVIAHAPCCSPNAQGKGLDGTAFRMVSGNTSYFRNLRDISASATRDDVRRALYNRWTYQKSSKTSLDPQTYLENLGINIEKVGAIAEPGAERLAIEGFRLYPTFPRALGRPGTRGFVYVADRDPNVKRRREFFIWPIWERAWSIATADAVFSSPFLYRAGDQRWLQDAGVVVRFAAPVRTYGQGYRVLERPEDALHVISSQRSTRRPPNQRLSRFRGRS